MNSSLPSILLVALAGGAAAGLMATFLLRPASSDAAAESSPEELASASQQTKGLDARVSQLEEENSALRLRLAELENRPQGMARMPVKGFVSNEEFEEFQDEVLRTLHSNEAVVPQPHVFKEQVASVLGEIRKEETVESIKGYHEKRHNRLDKDLEGLEKRLQLTPFQKDELRMTILAHYERESEQLRLWESGLKDEDMGARKRQDGEQFQTDLESVLTPEQVKGFWEAVYESRGN